MQYYVEYRENGVLGKQQLEWLFKFNTIDLTHWRLMNFDQVDEWVYVGDWKPTEINLNATSRYKTNDGGYGERHMHLKQNRYHYW
jgi:hypothetical protein